MILNLIDDIQSDGHKELESLNRMQFYAKYNYNYIKGTIYRKNAKKYNKILKATVFGYFIYG